jgi:hypothetical protein
VIDRVGWDRLAEDGQGLEHLSRVGVKLLEDFIEHAHALLEVSPAFGISGSNALQRQN